MKLHLSTLAGERESRVAPQCQYSTTPASGAVRRNEQAYMITVSALIGHSNLLDDYHCWYQDSDMRLSFLSHYTRIAKYEGRIAFREAARPGWSEASSFEAFFQQNSSNTHHQRLRPMPHRSSVGSSRISPSSFGRGIGTQRSRLQKATKHVPEVKLDATCYLTISSSQWMSKIWIHHPSRRAASVATKTP